MSKIFITGSSDGLGLLSAQALCQRGHAVYLHARNSSRAQVARSACPQAKGCLVADLSSTDETRSLASELNRLGPWDAIIHNAGVMPSRGRGSGSKTAFTVNTLAPYLLTCLLDPPAKRYVFLSSGMHNSGNADFEDIEHSGYSDTKLHNNMLSNYFARRLRDKGVLSNSLDPGWVQTKMGGTGAPDDIEKAVETYIHLAETADATGKHWYHSQERSAKKEAWDVERQDRLVGLLEKISGVSPPR
jgi:NAD(P)-dependent dehydrogenase (short-subunit alcohol dehydrogenase family)